MAEKHLNKCPTSLCIRKMQTKMTPRFHLIHVSMTKIKTDVTLHVGENMEQSKTSSIDGKLVQATC